MIHEKSSRELGLQQFSMHNTNEENVNSYTKRSSFAREADRADFHWGCHHQGSFWGVADSILIMHETALHNGLVLQKNLVAVTTLEALLIPVTFMGTVFHLLEIPYDTELSYCCNEVTLLFTTFSDL